MKSFIPSFRRYFPWSPQCKWKHSEYSILMCSPWYRVSICSNPGKDTVSEPGLEQIDTLYHGEHIRIEYSECFHLHWGDHGKYRLKLGMKDFMALCEAFSEVRL